MGRPRQPYTLEFKQEAVRLVQEENMTFAEVSQDLGVDNSTVRSWCRKAEAGQLKGPGRRARTMSMEEEVAQLRRENRILKEEREILKKAAAFFARESR